jgi:hypothetical protein
MKYLQQQQLQHASQPKTLPATMLRQLDSRQWWI